MGTYLGVDVVDGVQNKVRVAAQDELLGLLGVHGDERLDVALGHDASEMALETRGLGEAHVRPRGDRVAVQGRERDLIKVHNAKLADPGAEEHVRRMGADLDGRIQFQ